MKFALLRALAVLVCFFTAAGFAQTNQPPANPNATSSVRSILAKLQELSFQHPAKHLVSGQFSNFGNGADLRLVTKIHELTGHWPALMGVDYADFGRGALTTARPNAAAIDYWKKGGWVTVSAHLYNPANPNGGGLRDKGVDLESLLDAGSDTHARWMRELDTIAAGLDDLQTNGVTVFWRPFHEMNGGWFWWGAKDPEVFIKVWRQMFDYFTATKKLNNLIWVYSPNHGQNTDKYYAGDRYVDVVGLDAYTDFIDTKHIKGYAEVAALPKPFGFTEFGPHGASNPPGDYDYLRFIEGVETNFQRACFFMAWNDNWSLARNQHTKELLDDSRIINLEELQK
jgi:mannan endo-1,4-beta-mannosidase